ncbi:ribosome biogenesis related protein MAK21, putative [Babesia ovis]|uniref:Ribosome biogenesis related protein MAK21, putative n=1 Tax=Babesia ovis TaxID=5869 RepID=A0A9W5WWJ4_BABOV|nr:ribosome biogenesis related protein MAK21, putative [Babesia ovis]
MEQLQSVGRPLSDQTLLSVIDVYDSSNWHEVARQNVRSSSSKKSDGTLSTAKLLRSGKELLTVLARAYSRHVCAKDSNKAWMRITAKDVFIVPDKKAEATLCDSLDAMAVLASECCTLNYKFITSLLSMCKSTTVRVMMCSMERMHALFMELLPNRKLRYIHQVDQSCLSFLHHHHSIWEKSGAAKWDSFDPHALLVLHAVCFEDFLKGAYAAYIQLVKDQLEGGVSFVQRRMMQYIFEMLAKKPEQEGLLLDILVNRLITDEGKMSAMASAKLSALLECHSGMKGVVVLRVGSLLMASVEKLQAAFSSSQKPSPKKKKKRRSSSIPIEVIPTLQNIYRGILFLSTIKFTRKDTKAIADALKCYMSLLSFIFSPTSNHQLSRVLPVYEYEEFSRIIRCISSGLERCISMIHKSEGHFDIFKYASGDDTSSRAALETSIGHLYNAARNPISFKTNIACLSLISKLQPSDSNFYNLLYDRMSDIRMYDAENRRMLLSLIAHCMSGNADLPLVAAFIKRLLQVGTSLANIGMSIIIARICRGAMSSNSHLQSMLTSRGTDVIPADKGESPFKEADKSHLWECYLYRLCYHPTVVDEILSLNRGLKDGMVEFEVPNVFEELGAISGQLSGGDFEYTKRAYWIDGRKALPHQVVFKQFFEYRSACDKIVTSRKEKKSEESDSISDTEEEDELLDLDHVSPSLSADDISDSEDYDSDSSGVPSHSDDGDISDSEAYDSDSGDDISDADSDDGDISDSDDDSEISEEEAEAIEDTKALSKRSYEILETKQTEKSKTRKAHEDTVSPKDKTGKKKVMPLEDDDKDATATKPSKGNKDKSNKPMDNDTKIPREKKQKSPAATEGAKDVISKKDRTKSKRKGRDLDPEADSEHKKRMKISKMIDKVTKGSFADVSDIPGMEDYL